MRNSDQMMWDHDRALFERVKDNVPRPPGVLELRFEEAEDSQGEAAVRIYVVIEPEPHPTRERLRELVQYLGDLKQQIISGGVQTWPILELEEFETVKVRR